MAAMFESEIVVTRLLGRDLFLQFWSIFLFTRKDMLIVKLVKCWLV